MFAVAALVLLALAIGLVRVSLFASGLCWIGVFYAGAMADRNARESRFLPLIFVLAAVAFLIRVGLWAWHVI